MKIIGALFPAIVIAAVLSHSGFSQQPGIDVAWSVCEGKELKNDANLETVCWTDGDACRIFTGPVSLKKGNTEKEKLETARKTAALTAKYIFLMKIYKKREELLKKNCPADCEIEFTDNNPPAIAFKNVLENGTIMEELSYPDGSFRIIFEIREKNLKKRVSDYLKAYDTR